MRRLAGMITCLSLVALTFAQERKSSISGLVRDQSGGVVQGSEIRVRHLETGLVRVFTSNTDGVYRAPALELGEYEVSASKPGLQTSTHRGVVLELDREARVDHILRVGELSESVVVSGEAHLIEAASSVISSLVDSRTIEELPLNGRDYIQLATLEAGTWVARAQARSVNNGYGLQISISGSRPFQNSFWLDGMSVTNYNGSAPASTYGVNLGVDAIREFSVHTSTYSAQYGRAAGGVINAVTRAGGNEFHGGAFYFHRNDNLDARNFFDGAEPPEFRRHQFGGSLGGPIVRNKTFFFANYEHLRELRGNTTINTTLSDDARAGRLSSGAVRVDPVMAQTVALYPEANGEVFGDTGLFIFANEDRGSQGYFTTRIDHNPGDLDKLFFRYTFDDGSRLDETDFALAVRNNTTRSQSLAVEESHIFSPGLLNTARFGLLRTYTVAGGTTARVPGVDNPELAFLPGSQAVGYIVVSGLTDFPGGTGSLDSDVNAFTSFQYSDDLTWIRSRHSIKFGARFERTRFNSNSQNRAAGEYLFRSLADFLTNRPNRFRAQLPGSDTVRGQRQWIGAAYIHDTWRLLPRLTLDLGLRYEWATVPTEVNGKVSNLDEITSVSMRVGDPLFANPSRKSFAPRFGLAWDISGNGRTVLRGGYGIFPDLILSQFIELSGVRNPPFFLRGDARNLSPGDFPANGYAALVNNPSPEWRLERIPSDLQQPYVQQWNLNLERALGSNAALRVAYAGSHGLHLSVITEDANLVEPVVMPDGRLYYPKEGKKVNPVYGHIRDRRFDAHSFYHGLQSTFRRRFSRGLQAQASYSFSKSIDDSSGFHSPLESSNAISLPINGAASFNRGLSSHDVRHSISGSATWELPSPTQGLRGVLSDWQLGLIAAYAAGLPLSARLGYDAAQTQTSRPDYRSGQRPDLAPGASSNPVTGDPRRWIDPSAFRRPQDGFLGNLGRNTITGPDLANVDLSLVKRVRLSRLGERASLDLRFEFFNLLNRTNFDLPMPERMEVFNRTSTREDVGRVTSAGRSREIQIGVKFRF